MVCELIKHPSVVLITGARNNGKSALAHFIVEDFHKRNIPTYMLVFPQIEKKIRKLVPNWLHLVTDMKDAPENCIILCDESALRYHAVDWNKKETHIMENIISISRHRKQTVIFIAHMTRKFSVTLLDIDVLLCKKPGIFHSMIERQEFKKLIETVKKVFETIPEEDIKKYCYVYSDEFKGLKTNKIPEYWTENLSEAYAGVAVDGESVESEEEVLPARIESGLKIWFSQENSKEVLGILSKHSTIDGELSEMGIQCAGGKCYYSFDLGLINGIYCPSSKKFDLHESFKELKKKGIKFLVDIESEYKLTEDMVSIKRIEVEKEKKENDHLEEFARNLEL